MKKTPPLFTTIWEMIFLTSFQASQANLRSKDQELVGGRQLPFANLSICWRDSGCAPPTWWDENSWYIHLNTEKYRVYNMYIMVYKLKLFSITPNDFFENFIYKSSIWVSVNEGKPMEIWGERCRANERTADFMLLKNGGWKTGFPIGKVTFQGRTVKL